MPSAVAASRSAYESRVISHAQQLTPRPEREVFTIPLLPFFKLFRRLPIIDLVKQLFVRHVPATRKKVANVSHRGTLDAQGLADITSHWERRMETFASGKRLRDLFSDCVVSLGYNFGDHRAEFSQTRVDLVAVALHRNRNAFNDVFQHLIGLL